MYNSRLLLTLAFVAGAVGQTAIAQTTGTITRSSSYPPVGLASSETMQVNVVNLAANPTTITSTTPAASCTGSISFVNAAGTAIGAAAPFAVAAGVTQSVTLAFHTTGIAGTRGEVRAVLQTTTIVGRSAPPCSLASSLETFDSVSGATHVYLSTPVSGNSVGPIVVNTGVFQNP